MLETDMEQIQVWYRRDIFEGYNTAYVLKAASINLQLCNHHK
uniref:Uncharacterized protein n=1 Tax=Anguilla anguilla TaxID=7936 RepID=A0A0E9SIQ4_ANGAN